MKKVVLSLAAVALVTLAIQSAPASANRSFTSAQKTHTYLSGGDTILSVTGKLSYSEEWYSTGSGSYNIYEKLSDFKIDDPTLGGGTQFASTEYSNYNTGTVFKTTPPFVYSDNDHLGDGSVYWWKENNDLVNVPYGSTRSKHRASLLISNATPNVLYIDASFNY